MQERDLATLGALAEPVRRDLYAFVAAAEGPVSRDQAADGVGIPRHTAKFHLDKLAEEGLLDVGYQRLTGRTGPGAGRPAKVYQRSDREIEVSLPTRHYDLVGQILAAAVEQSDGTDVRATAEELARAEGRSAGSTADDGDLDVALSQLGYEPRRTGDRLVLDNCPFDRLARDHTELVCGLNLAYVEGVVEGLGCHGVRAQLEPGVARCCVTATVPDPVTD